MRVPGFKRQFRFPWRSRQEIHRDVDDELQFHLDMRVEELEAEGLPTDEAHRRAQSEFGDLRGARRDLKRLSQRQETRYRRLSFFDDLHQDLRFALRSLRRNPGFSAVAIVVLALAIGANTAIFSIVNMLLLRPLVIEEPERLTGLHVKSLVDPDEYRGWSYPNYSDLRERSTVFEDIAAFNPTLVGLEGEDGTTRRFFGQLISSNYFSTFAVPVAMGRGFTQEEETPNSRVDVVVLGHGFWERRGADPEILGKTLRINSVDFTIVGVTAEGFSGNSAVLHMDLWFPLGVYGHSVGDFLETRPIDLNDRDLHELIVIGRLADGRTKDEARLELESIGVQLAADFPDINGDFTIVHAPTARLSMSTRPMTDGLIAAASGLLMAMAGIVLLIACLNLANMLLARGAARRTEVAIRQSLGGGRARILRQLLTEGLLLSLAGGAAGLLLAFWAMKLLTSSFLPALPFGSITLDIAPDLRVLSATIAFSMLATLLFGLGPALKTVRKDIVSDLRETRGEGSGGGGLVPRNALVVAQISLSLVLLSAAGLFIRGAMKAANRDPGFDVERGLLVELDASVAKYDEPRTREVFARIVERFSSLPDVESVALASNVPMSAIQEGTTVELPGVEGEDSEFGAQKYIISRGYFDTMGLSIRGRDFTESESATDRDPPAVIVDEALAHRIRDDGDVVGTYLLLNSERGTGERVPTVIAGVVPSFRQTLLDPQDRPRVYFPHGQSFRAAMTVQLRLRSDDEATAAAVLGSLRTEIRNIDERLPILSMKTMRAHLDQSLEVWLISAGANVFTVFGAVAVLLAVIGVYGVKAYVVSRRTRELGIRMALGATPRDILWMILREGLVLTGVGIGVGLVLALLIGQRLAIVLYQVSPSDPVTFVLAPLALAAAAAAAAFVPARRATKIAPTTALRYE